MNTRIKYIFALGILLTVSNVFAAERPDWIEGKLACQQINRTCKLVKNPGTNSRKEFDLKIKNSETPFYTKIYNQSFVKILGINTKEKLGVWGIAQAIPTSEFTMPEREKVGARK